MSEQERRRARRVKIGQRLKARPSDPKHEHFEEFRNSKNVSSTGIYFTTRRKSYHKGMRLFVTVPYYYYYSPTDQMNCEYLAEVVRVDQLDKGEQGVALRLLSSLGFTR